MQWSCCIISFDCCVRNLCLVFFLAGTESINLMKSLKSQIEGGGHGTFGLQQTCGSSTQSPRLNRMKLAFQDVDNSNSNINNHVLCNIQIISHHSMCNTR